MRRSSLSPAKADLDEMDFGEGTSIENLDSQLYSGKPDIVEVRQAKANELFECIPC